MKYNHDNISPLDSRYLNKIPEFRKNFSESALIKIRFEIEIDWLVFLCTNLPSSFKPLSKESINKINNFKNKFDDKYVLKIKKLSLLQTMMLRLLNILLQNFLIKIRF